MEGQRNIRRLGDSPDPVKIDLRLHRIGAAGRADCDGERVDMGPLHILAGFIRQGEAVLIQLTRQLGGIRHMAELRFNRGAENMSGVGEFRHFSDIFLEILSRAVIVDRGEAGLQGLNAAVKRAAVIIVNGDRYFGIFCHREYKGDELLHRTDVRKLLVICQYDRCVQLLGRH